MTRRNQRARALAFVATLVLIPATAAAISPTPIQPLPDSAFVPISPLTQAVPDGPPATTSPRASIASATPAASRSVAPSRTPRPTVKPRPSTPVVTPRPAAHSIRGIASWYCNRNPARAVLSKCMAVHPDTGAFDAYAAAGPRLRVAMGGGVSVRAPDPWRGRIVTVCGRRCIRVKLSDWCACNTDPAHPKLLDLYYDVFALTGSDVKVSW